MPTEANDTLSSVQYASILEYLSEGECEGIEGGLKGVYLNKVPVENSDGSKNFHGLDFDSRTGSQSQTYIPTLKGTESETSANIEITKAASPGDYIFSVTNSEVDRVRITLAIPALLQQEEDGDITGHSVTIDIHVQYQGGSYAQVKSDTIKGKSSDTYQRDYLISLSGNFPVNIKVRRDSGDDASTGWPKAQSRTFVSSYTTIIDEKFRYPNSALSYLRFDATEFSAVPERRFLFKGIKVKIPSNATVDTTTHVGRITYSGVWDGTFKTNKEWTNDPAWCFYDLLISSRYGANISEATLDKWDFYNISQYCSELVSNGKGGQEPRFSLNIHLVDRNSVFEVIKALTSIFRGISYYSAGSLVLLQDKPATSQFLLGPSNVIGGTFQYEGTSVKARHTTATVAWSDYDDLGEIHFELVEDRDGITNYGIINKDIKALGTYSQGQAHRVGKWLLLSEQELTETCNFTVSIDAAILLRPGTIIDIADPLKSNTRRTGRISSATTTEVTLDSPADLSVDLSKNPELSIVMPTGLVETRDIDPSTNIGTGVIKVTSAFSEAPKNAGIWSINTSDMQTQQFRILGVKETPEDGVIGISCLKYNSSIYDAIEKNVSLTQRTISKLADPPDPVSNISNTEFLYQSGQNVLVGSSVSWSHTLKRVHEFRGRYKIDNDNWTSFTVNSPSITLRSLRAGKLYIELQAFNYVNKGSTTAVADFTLAGKTAVPGDVQNLTYEVISTNSARLRWTQTTDLDVKVGGKVHIRFSGKTDGTGTWNNSVDLINAIAGSATDCIVPIPGEGEIIVKFQDDTNNFSAGEASVIVTLPAAINLLGIQTRREDQDSPPFQGTKTDCFYSDVYDALAIDGTALFDAQADVDLIPNFDFLGDIKSSATYEFANTLDLESGGFALDLKRYFVTRAFLPGDLIDGRTTLIDTWNDFDGGVINNVDAKLYERHTLNDPASGSATWTSWAEFVSGTFKGRGFQFKAILTSTDVDQNILIDELGYTAELQQRTEQSTGTVASGAGAKTVSFDKPFFIGTSSLGGASQYLPSVGINAMNMASGDYFVLGTPTASNFQVTFKNSSGSNVDRNFTWSAIGWGKGV
jgi:predicted phage tail protein